MSAKESKPISAGQPVFPLRFKSPEDYPNVAKFSDSIDWSKAQQPISMYFKEEELKEEDTSDIVKDASYYKRRRKMRRSYRKKSTLVLEDASAGTNAASAPSGFRFEGRAFNFTLAEIEDSRKQAASASSSKMDDTDFKYVVLQFIKKGGDPSAGVPPTSEINVIPIGNMYAMKKRSGTEDELLEAVDDRFVQEKERIKTRISKYKNIQKSLDRAEKLKILREGNSSVGEFRGGFDSESLFGAAVSKAIGRRSNSSAASGGDGAGGSGGQMTFMNENGIDLEELKNDEWKGDYSSRYADDEEEHVQLEQQQLDDIESSAMSASMRYDGVGSGAGDWLSGDEDDDDDGDDEDDEDDDRNGAGSDDEGFKTGMVDSNMVLSVAEARGALAVNRASLGTASGPVGGIRGASSSSSSGHNLISGKSTGVKIAAAELDVSGVPAMGAAPLKSALKKRRRGEDNGASGVTFAPDGATGVGGGVSVGVGGGTAAASAPVEHARVSFLTTGDDAAAVSGAVSAAAVSGAVSAAAATATAASSFPVRDEYPLSAAGLRDFINSKGGKVTMRELEYFKPQIKAYGAEKGDKSAGKKRFVELLDKVTISKEEALLGKVLFLKPPAGI